MRLFDPGRIPLPYSVWIKDQGQFDRHRLAAGAKQKEAAKVVKLVFGLKMRWLT
jgi:hypothetical protein